jgi:hypothetical protein
MSPDMMRFVTELTHGNIKVRGADAMSPDAVLTRYPQMNADEVAAIAARSDAELIGLGAPYAPGIGPLCWFTCGVSCTITEAPK